MICFLYKNIYNNSSELIQIKSTTYSEQGCLHIILMLANNIDYPYVRIIYIDKVCMQSSPQSH